MRHFTPVLATFSIFLLNGCATPTLQTTKFDLNNGGEGISYYLPKRLHEATAKQEFVDGKCNRSFTLKEGPLVPDVNQRYILKPVHNVLRDDDFGIKTTKSGLLQSAKVTSEGKAGKVIVDIAGALATQFGALGVNDSKNCKTKVKTIVLDLTNESERNKVTYEADLIGVSLDWGDNLTALAKQEEKKCALLKSSTKNSSTSESVAGVCYRRQLTYRLVSTCQDLKQCIPEVTYLQIPQGGPIDVIRTRANLFTTSGDELEFDNGMLTKWDSNTKSEAAVVAQLPLEIMKKILEVPTSLLTLRTAKTNSEKALVDAEVAAEKNSIVSDLKLEILKTCIIAAGDDQLKVIQCIN